MIQPFGSEWGDSLERLQRHRRERARKAGDNTAAHTLTHVPSMYTAYRYPLLVTELLDETSQEDESVNSNPTPLGQARFETGSQYRRAAIADLQRRLEEHRIDIRKENGQQQEPDSMWYPLVSMCQMTLIQNPAWTEQYDRMWARTNGDLPLHPRELQTLRIATESGSVLQQLGVF